MNRFILFVGMVCFVCLHSVEIIFVPDYRPYAKTLFIDGDVPDYQRASLWNKVKYLLSEQGHTVKAATLEEVFSRKKAKHQQIVIWNRPNNIAIDKLKKIDSKYLSLIVFEPPSVLPELHKDDYYSCFSKVLTWEDDRLDSTKFKKFHHPVCYPMINEIVPFVKRKLCTIMAANKKSKFVGEIYSERRRAIEYFNNYPEQFDLYGPDWKKEHFITYKGIVDSKIDTLKQYKFSICYENTVGMNGYVTEKIFDCMRSGVVPVYLGAPNIAEEVPSNCFIDRRNFSSYEALHKYLLDISEEEFDCYVNNMKTFLVSRDAKKYTVDGFALAIVNGLTGANLSLADLPD